MVLLTTTWRGKANVMPLSWHMPLSSSPTLVGVAVERSRHTGDMIRHSQEFALNFPARPLLHHVQYLGSLRGEAIDKFEATQLETFAPSRIASPLLSSCLAWVECEVVEVLEFGDHVLFVGLAVSVRVDPDAFDDRWLVADDEDRRPLHFLGGHAYSYLQRVLEARVPADADAPERVLRERLEEELELSREARERREERVEALRDEVRRGNVVDVSELEFEIDEDDALDLSKGHVLGE